MSIIGEKGVRGFFLREYKRKKLRFILSIALPIVIVISGIIILGFVLEKNHKLEKEIIETMAIIFMFMFALVLLNERMEKNSTKIEIKNKKEDVREKMEFEESHRLHKIKSHNRFNAFFFFCYHCNNRINVDFHTKVACPDCSDYGYLSSKLKQCSCGTILRYIECPHCYKELDLIQHEYNHKQLNLSKDE